MRRRNQKPLTPEQEKFYAGFNTTVLKVKGQPAPSAGDRVRITGEHPHAGKSGEVLGYDVLQILNETAMKVRCDDGEECFVFGRHQFTES